jgi:adenylate cyclase
VNDSGSRARARIQTRQLAAIVLVACVLVPLFNVLTDERSLGSVVQALVDAIVIPVLVGGYLLFVRDGWLRVWFRRRRFVTDFALSSVIVLALFLVGRAIGQVITTGNPRRFVLSFTDTHLAYALPFFVVLALVIQFVLRTNRMIGTSMLRYFVAGTYHRPRTEERVFLFVDLEGSTKLAERLGSATYFELLRRFVDDLTEPVVATRGEIYQYAGDEVVVSWPLAIAVRSANCVRCFFAIHHTVARAADRYQRDFGVVPGFRAGLHGGTVTAGELGDLRQQIVFVGDILNTAARLQEHAKRAGLGLVASAAILKQLEMPDDITVTSCGELELRGKQDRVTAYSLSRRLL